MTKSEGRGVLVLLTLLDAQLRRLGESSARALIDGLDDEQLPDVALAISSAERAVNGEPNLIVESLAARLRKVDVEAVGSGVCGETWGLQKERHCGRPAGHCPPCCEIPVEGDFSSTEH